MVLTLRMDLSSAMSSPHPLATELGRRALDVARAQPDPGSLGAATALRRKFASELASAALTQVELERRATDKLGDAAPGLLFTRTGLEQATRWTVATWRASELVRRGVEHVVDLGCGLGIDALACLRAGLEVTAVELDALTASAAAHNLAGARVLQGRAEELAGELLAGAGAETCVFLDPARRSATGRSWRVADLTPSWDFVLEVLAGPHQTCVKLGPGVDRSVLPETVDRVWVSDAGDVVEASLWTSKEPRDAAVLLDRDATHLVCRGKAPALGVGAVGEYLHEPDGAALRARVVPEVVRDAWWLADGVGYLASDERIDSPWLTSFRVVQHFAWSQKALKAWCREHRVGTLEIKKRALDVDPAVLRRQLGLKGNEAATVVLTPTVEGTRCLVVERV